MPTVYIVRHAHAVPETADPARPLSAAGHDECQRLVSFLKPLRLFTPTQFWHSPLARAKETAVLLRDGLAPSSALLENHALLPEHDPREIASRLDHLPPTACVAAAGHEPHLSALATLLFGGSPTHPAFVFEKGAILALQRDDAVSIGKTGRWQVLWQIDPTLLPAR